jgi:hypothetical protein
MISSRSKLREVRDLQRADFTISLRPLRPGVWSSRPFYLLAGVNNRTALVVTDPACGSRAFLTESIRTIRRIGFNGRLTLVGRDVSAAAINMARFALEAARYDWEPRGGQSVTSKL